MKREEQIKKDNKKAMPRFVLICVGALVLGVLLGLGIVWLWFDGQDSRLSIQDTLSWFFGSISHWMVGGVTLVCMPIALYFYYKGKRLWQGWDGEDEKEIERADYALSLGLMASNVNMILTFLFFGVTGALTYDFYGMLIGVALMFVSMAVIVRYQQKVVDLCRRMNPEKEGSVYDTKFQKKWLESCDEAERMKIYQSAFRAYSVMNKVCPALWCVMVLGGFAFDFGPMAVVSVSILWLILSVSYQLEAIRLEKK